MKWEEVDERLYVFHDELILSLSDLSSQYREVFNKKHEVQFKHLKKLENKIFKFLLNIFKYRNRPK